MPQPNVCDIFRLHLVNAEAYHKVRHNLVVMLRLAHNFDRLVDVQQNRLKSL